MPYKDKAKHREYQKNWIRKRRGSNKGSTKQGSTYLWGSTTPPDVMPLEARPVTPFRTFSKLAQIGKA